MHAVQMPMIGTARVHLNLDRAPIIITLASYLPHFALLTITILILIPIMADRHSQHHRQPDHPYLLTRSSRQLENQVRPEFVDRLKQVFLRARDRVPEHLYP